LLNASVGVRRAVARLLPTRIDRARRSVRFHRRSVVRTELPVQPASLARNAKPMRWRVVEARASRVRRVARPGPEAAVPVAVALIVTLASVLSWLPGEPARGAVGGTTAEGSGSRIAAGGVRSFGEADLTPIRPRDPTAAAPAPDPSPLRGPGVDYSRIDPDAAAAEREAELAAASAIRGPFAADGTLLKPIAVTTTLADGKDLLRSHTVRKGETLAAVADRFGVSTMSVVWANGLKSMGVKEGTKLVIPPFNGVVLTVREGDTLAGISKKYKVPVEKIYATNGLEDLVLIAGQTLVLPGAKGDPLPKPKPKPPRASPSSGGGTTVRPPATYAGGAMVWPVVGGGNTISQSFHYGHYGIDIAADYGSRVRAAAGGTVTFAGWKSNGGGYQVWIAHGSGLYTTYNHMSGVSVGAGQRVGAGQQVGRIGQSGLATGPHLHFEVWKGPIWSGGTRVNPMRYF
jgi:murein DD-endopeptidase MepM/ murein hydrolase activator NlpD